MVRKLGPISNLLGMLPGAAQNREALSQVSDKDLDRAAAIVNSMTPEERSSPKMINGSRRSRIAAGSGVTVGEVNSMIVRFLEGQKMMRQMVGGMPGMRRAGQKAARGKSKKKAKGGGRPGGNSGGRSGGGAGAGTDGAASAPGGGRGPAGLPAGFGPGAAGGSLPPGLPGGLGGRDGSLQIPAGRGNWATPPPNLPAGLRGGPPNRRGRPGKKGR